MAKITGRAIQVQGVSQPQLQDDKLFSEGVINGGMVTVIDPADLKANQFTLCKNSRIRFDKTSRRGGKLAYGPTKPNSTLILKLFDYKKELDSIYKLRFTYNTIHYTAGATWTALSGSLNTSPSDYYEVAQVEDILCFVNRGKNRIQKIDIGAGTFSDLGADAPYAKTVTGFGNRVVGGNLGSTLEEAASLAWSGDLNFDEFDSLVDPSAGQSPLTEGARDIADPIQWIQGLTTLMVIVRENSIWLGSKLAIESQPFNFQSVRPDYGTNAPQSPAIGRDGVIVFDPRSKLCYQFNFDGSVDEIGQPIENQFLLGVTDPTKFQGEYSKFHKEYYLRAENKLWTFNFNTKAWQYDELSGISTVCIADLYTDVVTVDELTGTVNALAGTVDELSATPIGTPAILYGYTNGDISQQDETLDQDLAVDYTFEARSKLYEFESDDVIVTQILLKYICSVTGTLILQYSKDNAASWITAKSFTLTADSVEHTIRFKRAVKSKNIMWRVTATRGLFDLTRYQLYVNEGGELTAK